MNIKIKLRGDLYKDSCNFGIIMQHLITFIDHGVNWNTSYKNINKYMHTHIIDCINKLQSTCINQIDTRILTFIYAYIWD